jgi:hypothetical protein
MAVLTTEEIIRFKDRYIEALKKNSIKVSLSPHHRDRHDVWAYEVLGNSEFVFMYPILIHNEDDAMENGYFITGKDRTLV